MKKIFTGVLALTMMLSICACSFAESDAAAGELVTLAELKAQAPASVSFTINGTTYNVPVMLPDGDEMPILLCERMTFDTSNLREKYLIDPEADRTTRVADAAWHYNGSPIISYDLGSSVARRGRTDVSTRQTLPMGELPPEVEWSPKDCVQLAHDRLVEFGGNPDTLLRVWHAAPQSGKYYMKTEKVTLDNGVSFRMPTIDPKKPVKNASKGAWNLVLAQVVEGAVVFPFFYRPQADTSLESPFYSPAYGHLYFVDEHTMSLGLTVLKEKETLASACTLAPLDTVLDSLQQRIDEGQLQSAYQMTLGYTAVLVKGDALSGEDNRYNAAARFVLVPTWSVEGYDLKDRKRRWNYGYTAPDRDTVLQESVGADGFELRLNAVTGKVLQYFEYDLEEIAQ